VLGAATTTAPLITSAIRILLMKYLRDSQDAIYDASIAFMREESP
jgi:hypothetical protein